MRIASGQTIAGVELVQVRDALRYVKDREFDVQYLRQRLGLPEDVGTELLGRLAEQGFLERAPGEPIDGDVLWRLTVQGNALTNANAAKPVKRATAQRALDELLERVGEVNADDKLAYQVDEVVVFGSFLDADADVVGDVDVAVGLSARYAGEEHARVSAGRVRAAADAGRQFNNIIDELSWPQVEVVRHLKRRSRVLSLTTVEDGILDLVEYRSVFVRDGAEPRRP